MSQAASSTTDHGSSSRPEDSRSVSQLHHIEVAKSQLATLPSEEARIIINFLSSLPPPPDSSRMGRDIPVMADRETQTASGLEGLVDSKPHL